MRNSLIIAAILFFVYNMFLEYGPKPVQTKMQSQWQENRHVLERYFRDSQHAVVYVGSSLTRRLDFSSESKCVYNLSFNGGSAQTGLSAIVHSAVKPRVVFVEINVPQRGIDQDLIAKASGILTQLSAAFHIENMPVNLAYSFLYSFVHSLKINKPSQDVNEAVRSNAITLQTKLHQKTLSADILKSDMAELGSLVKNIESTGTKVVFFEMPIYPDLEYTTRAVQIRNAFKDNFPDNQLIGLDELTNGRNIKTVDGLHLSDDEAKIVVGNMKMHFKDACQSAPQ